MQGYYSSGLPFLRVRMGSQNIESLLDTGFNGELLLSVKRIKELNLRRLGFAEYITADGSVMDSEIFSAEIEWFSALREVSVLSSPSNFALLGMGLLQDVKTVLEPSKNVLVLSNQ